MRQLMENSIFEAVNGHVFFPKGRHQGTENPHPFITTVMPMTICIPRHLQTNKRNVIIVLAWMKEARLPGYEKLCYFGSRSTGRVGQCWAVLRSMAYPVILEW